MTFQERKLIQESFFGNNKMKYATGALAGALGVAANHITGGEDNVLDELKGAHEQGNLWNTILDKGQSGLESFKTGPDTSKIQGVIDSADGGDHTESSPTAPSLPRQSNLEMLAKQNEQSIDTQNEQDSITKPQAPTEPGQAAGGQLAQNSAPSSYQSRHTA